MKDIFISYSKEDKTAAKKIVSKLEAEGWSCIIYPRDNVENSETKQNDDIASAKAFVLLLSKFSENSQQVYKQLHTAVDNNVRIIPVKTDATSDSLTLKYFLHTIEWVDLVGDGFDDAYDILKEILNEIFEGKIPQKIPQKNLKFKTDSKSANSINKIASGNILTIVFALLAVVFAFLYFTDKPETDLQTENQNKNELVNNVAGNKSIIQSKPITKSETFLAGTWKMTDYADSRNLSEAEKAATMQSVEALKKTASLVFNSDRSFSRIGFTPQPQTGIWEFSAAEKKIYLQALNEQRVESVNLSEYSDKKMIFVVTENIQENGKQPEIVTTKITFEKVK